MTGRVINQQSFSEGRIVLYQIEGRKNGYWICRIKVPSGKGYIYRGTGTADFYEARRVADGILDDLKMRVRLGQSVTGPSLKKMVDEYDASCRSKGELTKREQAVLDFLQTYAVPYFNKNKVSELSASEVAKFFEWRRLNSKKRVSKDPARALKEKQRERLKKRLAAKDPEVEGSEKSFIPSESTILHETSIFQTFLKWCFKRGLVSREISLDRPKQVINRRPHFDDKDWDTLTRFFRVWLKDAEGKSGPILRDRTMLKNYVLILANTGIRVGEARYLRWRDLDRHFDQSGEMSVILNVKGKTGSREVVSRTNEIELYLNDIYRIREEETESKPKRDEFIFCHRDGKPIQSFKKGFEAMIKEAGVLTNSQGERRTLYSLRHTYATFRLREGVNHYVLAKNMGTSVKMIEQFYGHVSNRAMSEELKKHREKPSKPFLWD